MRWKTLRLSTFVATGLSAFAPIIHATSIFPYAQLDKQAGLRYYYLEGLLILIGVGFYAVSPSMLLQHSVLTLRPCTDMQARLAFRSPGDLESLTSGALRIRSSTFL
jgi:predicted membrane channel-forming protein YqfA (hemolysin III family)